MSPRSHSYYQDLLEQHISGVALPPPDRMDLFDHMETCDACRHMLEAEERITARMKTVPRLVAPSDLRSKILTQAIRDHRERTTTPSDDPTISDLLKSRPAPSDKPRPHSPHQNEDIPVFAGITAPTQSRLRRAWRRASPVMATSFLAVTSIGALYMGQFQGIPLAGEAQQLVWSASDYIFGSDHAPSNLSNPIMVASSAQPVDNTVFTGPTPTENWQNAISPTALGDSTRPIPGTRQIVDQVHEARDWIASIDYTVAALARATEERVPGPAENATPQIAALVLKPTDRQRDTGGFRQSELASALESVAVSQPGGRVARQDQFTMDGHRYRLYTLDLPAGCTHQMVETLSPYQSPSDIVVVNALVSQNQVKMSRNQNVQFYSTNEALLRSALENITPVSSNARKERVRVVVVE